MIQIKVYGIKKNNKLEFDNTEVVKFEINGHAFFSEYGSDIVCAAVSALIQTELRALKTITNIELLVKKEKNNFSFEFTSNKLSTKIKQNALIIIETTIIGLEEISKKYPQNVEIEYF